MRILFLLALFSEVLFSQTFPEKDLRWAWDNEPRWLSGVNFGHGTFFGGVEKGYKFFGSTIQEEQLVEVMIRFSQSDTTYAQTYRRDQSYAASGPGVFYGSAWDISDPQNPRRLNVCLSEDDRVKPANNLWDPDTTGQGGREYLFVMASDYDGSGTTYNDDLWGLGEDVLYGLWPRVLEGRQLYETDPAELSILFDYVPGFFALPASGQNTLKWRLNEIGEMDEVRLYYGLSSPADQLLGSFPATSGEYIHNNLTDNTPYYYRVDIYNNSVKLSESQEIVMSPRNVSSGMTLLNNIHSYKEYGDIWGYSAEGKEYALLCARGSGLSIIDITGTDAVEVGFAPSIEPDVDSKDVKVYNNYAILINENAPAQIFDLSNPALPEQVAIIELPFGEGAHNCYVDGDYLYIVGDHETGGLFIFDISNPLQPAQVGSFTPFYYHDVYVRGNTAYAAGIYGDGVDIIDLTDKTQPILIARFNYAGSGAHNVWTSEDGNYIFVGDEIGTSGNHTRVFNISNTDDIQHVSDIIVEARAATHNCYVKGNLLYIGHYTEGVQVYDISDPANPQNIAHYDTYPQSGFGYYGTWSVYPYFESGKIIASDMQTGLYVMALSDNPSSIAENPAAMIPGDLLLNQNFPNPFNPYTIISFSLPQADDVTIRIVNTMGQQVDILKLGERPQGHNSVKWFPKNLAGGIYFYQINSASGTRTKKLTLVK